MNMQANQHEDLISLDLLKLESSKTLGANVGITTVTFFKTGDVAQAVSFLKKRFNLILKANPWLAGRLIKQKGHPLLQLVYSEQCTDMHRQQLFNEKVSIKLSTKMPYHEIYAKVTKNKQVFVPSGLRLINKDKPLTRVSIVSVEPGSFSLIFSLSHTIADGATYYRLLNMLCSNEEVIALNAVRKHDYSMKKAIGKENNDFVFYKTFILGVIASMLFGHKAKLLGLYVNEDEVKKTKAKVSEEKQVPFVSTNDILTSNFMRAIKARICIMAINFRNRFPGID